MRVSGQLLFPCLSLLCVPSGALITPLHRVARVAHVPQARHAFARHAHARDAHARHAVAPRCGVSDASDPEAKVSNGLVLLALSLSPATRPLADKLEAQFGGRVCPMQFDPVECDPFVLLVHHRHSFRPFDPFRPLFSALILPEGFPAHPHRGFETVTIAFQGAHPRRAHASAST